MKLGIVGSGMIVNDFLSMVGDLPNITLSALLGTERSYEKLVSLQKDYGFQQIYTQVDLFLAEADIDTVYIALPNHLHFEYAKKALEQGKHVICEKPFTLNLEDFQTLKALAIEKQLILVEAITNQFLPNYHFIKETLPTLGDIKVIECNYSQYSSRYDAFKEGTILPAFNPKMGGGALMDINIYNIHFVIGLLGKPESVKYYPNIENNIDTSGILMLEYPETKAVCIGAKDCSATIRSTIQGNKGSLAVIGATNDINEVEVQPQKNDTKLIHKNTHNHRMFEEFNVFQQLIEDNDIERSRQLLAHSENVMIVLDQALKSANLKLG